MLRRLSLCGLLSVAAGLVAAPAALAVASSSVTSPSSPFYAFWDSSVSPTPTAFTATGTVSGFTAGDLNCYYDNSANAIHLADNVDVTSGSFSVPVSANQLPNRFFPPRFACVVRMVPHGDTGSHPPGTANDPYAGPLILAGRFFPRDSDYDLATTSSSANLDLESAGGCGLEQTALLDGLLNYHLGPFGCNGWLRFTNASSLVTMPTRSDIQVDGADAYDPIGVTDGISSSEPGLGPIFITSHSFDPTTGLVSISTREPILVCAAGAVAFPPDRATTCPSVRSAGVELDRSWVTSAANQVIDMTDNWVSTDGKDHRLDLLMRQDYATAGAGGGFEFPGQTSFSAPTLGETVSLHGPGVIYDKVDAGTPDSGDQLSPQGSTSYSTAPDAPSTFTIVSPGSQTAELTMPYRRTVPARGAFTLRMRFAYDFALAPVQAAAAAALATYTPPRVAITSPVNGSVTGVPSVVVSGTVSGSAGINSVTVNGTPAARAADRWSATVPLRPGANSITATATDAGGATGTAQVLVSYVPGRPGIKGHVSISSSGVSVAISCTGGAGSSCSVSGSLTSTEKLLGKRVVSVATRRRARSRTVTVGSAALTIRAGHTATLTVSLNGLGKRLLARFGRLPARLVVRSGQQVLLRRGVAFRPRHRRTHHHR